MRPGGCFRSPGCFPVAPRRPAREGLARQGRRYLPLRQRDPAGHPSEVRGPDRASRQRDPRGPEGLPLAPGLRRARAVQLRLLPADVPGPPRGRRHPRRAGRQRPIGRDRSGAGASQGRGDRHLPAPGRSLPHRRGEGRLEDHRRQHEGQGASGRSALRGGGRARVSRVRREGPEVDGRLQAAQQRRRSQAPLPGPRRGDGGEHHRARPRGLAPPRRRGGRQRHRQGTLDSTRAGPTWRGPEGRRPPAPAGARTDVLAGQMSIDERVQLLFRKRQLAQQLLGAPLSG
mmetsp:Transcript_11534/g.34187  ORF Transcript_11534/g.34187 Transcript_11534/m.34187 type:complete len:287 (-) Transcript_11534:101-961(-)